MYDLSETKRNELIQKLRDMKVECQNSISHYDLLLRDGGEKHGDHLDIAQALESRSRNIAMREQKIKSLKDISFALNNLDDFGFCFDCDESIPVARLEFRPECVCCVDCQQMRESVS